MERRKFLGAGAALATLASPRWLFGQACPPTEVDRYGLGPYYLAGGPNDSQIGPANEPGEKLTITGVVSNCQGVLPGIRLEVWLATNSGCYVHPSMNCDNHPGNDTAARLWGQVLSGADGKYSFNTIKPGRYLNGSRYRPSHIHFRISTPGKTVAQGGLDLITQLYFAGDEFIEGDFAADHASAASRIITLTKPATGATRGTFNINLPGVPTGLGLRDPLSDPALSAFDVSIHRSGSRVLFQLPPAPSGQAVEMRLFAADGSLVRRSLHHVLPVEMDATFLPKGRYQAEFRWWSSHGMRLEKASIGI